VDDWPIEELFDEDYLLFLTARQSEESDDADAALVAELLGDVAGARILDLGCGHGRIANRLAARGARVTGLDATPLFLDRAREDAARRGVDVDFVAGDMRALPWAWRFDAVVSWFTAFGYFDVPRAHVRLHRAAGLAARRRLPLGRRACRRWRPADRRVPPDDRDRDAASYSTSAP